MTKGRGEQEWQDPREQAGPPIRPPMIPPPPPGPPQPVYAPGAAPVAPSPGAAFVEWVQTPRPADGPGIWRLGHRPRPEDASDLTPARQLLGGALGALLVAWLVWTVIYDGVLGTWWWLLPLTILLPNSWLHGSQGPVVTWVIYYGYYALIAAVIALVAGRAGRWPEVWRRYVAPRIEQFRQPVTETSTGVADLAAWPQLRATGSVSAADRLAAEAAAGKMSDVDYARITQAWQTAVDARQTAGFVRAVLEEGAAAFLHPSGRRDLPARTAQHDLVTRQVRLGTAVDSPKNPHKHRTTSVALGPETMGTSLLALGPAGSGKTTAVLRPVVESLCLQALAGQAAVVVVAPAGAALGPAEQYDVVIRLGDPASAYDLDLYGGMTDADSAAAILAEALAGDAESGLNVRHAALALAQLLAPWHAAYGRFPTVANLRQLLDGSPGPLDVLREELSKAGQGGMLRELDARQRAATAAGDIGAVLADRLGLVTRAGVDVDDTAEGRPFSMWALEHPVRVRIDLPARAHPEVSRILTRLVLAQFLASVPHRRNTGQFVGLVVDDAGGAITAETVRGLPRLRAVNAGVVLGLRTLDEVSPTLRNPLLGAVGCQMALPGLPPADGRALAEVWGTEWTQAQDVTEQQAIARGVGQRMSHLVRKGFTGQAPTIRAVTVRQVERQRWSASELGHAVGLGHAVISMTDVEGERTPPILVNFRD